MSRHPTLDIPNVGPIDHAWDALGEWQIELDDPDEQPFRAVATRDSEYYLKKDPLVPR